MWLIRVNWDSDIHEHQNTLSAVGLDLYQVTEAGSVTFYTPSSAR